MVIRDYLVVEALLFFVLNAPTCLQMHIFTATNKIDFDTQVQRYEELSILNQNKPEDVRQVFDKNVHDLLVSYVDSLEKIKEESQKLQSAHKFSTDLRGYKYVYANDNNSVRIENVYSTDLAVNLNISFLQAPTEVYRNHIAILHDAKWSKPLNDIFLKNFEGNPTLQWQYLGTENGAFRSFPGSK